MCLCVTNGGGAELEHATFVPLQPPNHECSRTLGRTAGGNNGGGGGGGGGNSS